MVSRFFTGRSGYLGKTFRICKFRTMVKNADQIGGSTTSLHDPRITKVGNFLRKTKLDEIPQLGQVFMGKMSLIGPRPELLQYVNQYISDMWDRSDQNADVVCSLIRELVTVAPVYYGYGNHEKEWEAIHAESLTVALEEAGAVVLDCSYADVMVAGTELRIGSGCGSLPVFIIWPVCWPIWQ